MADNIIREGYYRCTLVERINGNGHMTHIFIWRGSGA